MQNLSKGRKLKKIILAQFFPSPVYPSLHIHTNVFPDGTHSPFVGSQSLPMHGSIARSRKKKFKKKHQISSARNTCKFHCNLYVINPLTASIPHWSLMG